MSFRGMLVHDVTIIAPGGIVDRYGDTIPDWSTPASETPTKGWIYQRRSDEDHAQGRDEHSQQWRAYLPADAAVRANYRIDWPALGLVFEVDGPPRVSYRPTSSTPELHHLEVDLKHVAG